MQATPDGQFLVFDSRANLLGSISGLSQVYEYDALSERLVRVSVSAANYPLGMTSAETHESSIVAQSHSQNSAPTIATTRLAVSEDGLRVIFYSKAALAEGAEAGKYNVYEYRDVGGSGNAGAGNNVYLIAANIVEPGNVGLDATGADVFFETADPLVPSDVDTQFDIYDAREDSGLSAPITPVPCVGEECQGAPSVPPLFGAPGSASASGGGNLTGVPPATLEPLSEQTTTIPKPKPVKCKKGFSKRHGRCVKTTRKKPKTKSSRNGGGDR